jgi:hypothetical protein
MSSERRELKFDNLDQVSEELNRLCEGGYTQTGNWNLSQICGHCHDWMRYSLDGYPKAPPPIRLVLWLMKVTVGRRQFDAVVNNGFKAKLPTMPETVPNADAESDAAAVEQLTKTINRLKASKGPIVPSPLYGPLNYGEAVQLQLAHCAHHLSFLNPKA